MSSGNLPQTQTISPDVFLWMVSGQSCFFMGVGEKVGKAGHSYLCHRSHHMSTWLGHTSVYWQKTQRELLRDGEGRANVWPSLFIHPMAWGICGISQELMSALSPPWCWVSALPHAPAMSLHLFQVFALPKRWPLWPSSGQALQWLSSGLWGFPLLLQDRRDYSHHLLFGWSCVGAHHLLPSHTSSLCSWLECSSRQVPGAMQEPSRWGCWDERSLLSPHNWEHGLYPSYGSGE